MAKKSKWGKIGAPGSTKRSKHMSHIGKLPRLVKHPKKTVAAPKKHRGKKKK